MDKRSKFKLERTRLNEITVKFANTQMKKIFHLDSAAYEKGFLSTETKELLGFVASLVLRCDDCILYHLDRCLTLGFTKNELVEAINVALMVGGSITIPHIRRIMDVLDEEQTKEEKTF